MVCTIAITSFKKHTENKNICQLTFLVLLSAISSFELYFDFSILRVGYIIMASLINTENEQEAMKKKFDSEQSFFQKRNNDPSKPLLSTSLNVHNANDGEHSFFCCTPFQFRFRVVILIFICLITYGSYFSYDNPGALTVYFKKHICHNDTENYLALYSVYSWPNTIQPFIGGWIIDSYLGVGKSAVIFSGLVLVGSAIVALSGSLYDVFPSESYVPFYIAVLGRFVFGLGGESLSVAQSTMTGKWFRGHQLATAFAITLSFSRGKYE